MVLSLKSSKREDLSGELVGVLCSAYSKLMGRRLDIVTSNNIKFKSNKSTKSITVLGGGADSDNPSFIKNKDGSIVYNA